MWAQCVCAGEAEEAMGPPKRGLNCCWQNTLGMRKCSQMSFEWKQIERQSKQRCGIGCAIKGQRPDSRVDRMLRWQWVHSIWQTLCDNHNHNGNDNDNENDNDVCDIFPKMPTQHYCPGSQAKNQTVGAEGSWWGVLCHTQSQKRWRVDKFLCGRTSKSY